MSWREDLKRFNGPYYRWALENRRKFLTTELATEKALAKEVEGMVKDLSVSIEGMPSDVAAQMKYVREGLKDFAKALNGKQKDIISKGIEKAVGIGVEYNEKVSADLLLKVFPEVAGKIQNVFGSVQEDVIKAMWNRRVGGLYLSDRIWNITGDTTEAIGRILTAGIATNMDPVDIARALTKYVKEGSGTLVKDYPNMMKRMGRRLPKDLNYESLRLVRTELSAAHGDATLKSATYNPACRGVKWVLSSEHPEYDICDELAYADQGLGPGVYRVEDAPPMPAHPNCLCFFTEVVEDPNAFVQRLERFRDNPDSDPELQEYWQRTFAKPSEEEEDIINLDDYVDLYEKYQPDDYANEYGLNNTIEDVKKHSHFLVHEATPEEREAAEYYTSSLGYEEYNQALRFPEIGKTAKRKTKKMIEALTNFIKKASPLSQNTIFYRHDKLGTLEHLVGPEVREIAEDIVVNGDTSKMPELKKLLIRSVIQDKGFLSTSYRQGIFVYENGLEIRIHAPKGFRGGLFLEEISKFPREREYLFAPGQKFRVLDVEAGEIYEGTEKQEMVKNLILHVVPVE